MRIAIIPLPEKQVLHTDFEGLGRGKNKNAAQELNNNNDVEIRAGNLPIIRSVTYCIR